MRAAGRVVAEMHERIRAAVAARRHDARARRDRPRGLERRGATSNFLGYHGFPAVICASPNDMIVHGIPGDYVLREGDIISIDCGAIVDGWHGDAAFTMGVGEIDPGRGQADRRHRGVAPRRHRRDGRRATASATSAHAVQEVAEAAGLLGRARVRRPCHRPGHARGARGARTTAGRGRGAKLSVGQRLRRRADGQRRRPPRPILLDDGWSVVTADGSLSAHWEHTIAITDDGPEILTLP